MTAITITQELKDLNNLPQSVGSIRTFNNIPKSLYSVVYNNGQRTDGYNKLLSTVHYDEGFRDVVTPTIDDATQKLGALFFDGGNDYFTYYIVAKTQEEQDDYQQSQEDADQYGQKASQRKADGDRMIERFFAYIWRQNGGGLSNADALTAVTLIWDALLPVSYGQMEFAKIRLNAIDQTGLNQPVIDIINLAISKIQNYLDNE